MSGLDCSMFYKTYEIVEHMEDDLSRELYNIRTMYSIGRISRHDVIEKNRKLFTDWTIPELDKTTNQIKNKEICIFGAGEYGYLTYITLKSCNKYSDYSIFFVDNNCDLWDKTCFGVPVIKPEELKKGQFKGIVIIANALSFSQVYHQLLFLVDREQIFVPANDILIGRRGNQYFDYFKDAGMNDVFVDCGCYDGQDAIKFTKWCNNKYKYIYGFEPNEFDYNITNSRLLEQGINNVTIFNSAVGNVNGMIPFDGDGFSMGHVDDKSDCKVRCVSIDKAIEEKVTFIKMDIEGEELNAIEGAEDTIKRYKPRLAICIYHKNEDPWTIPSKILDFNDTYRFAIRQYWMWPEECVLYAF